MLEDIPITPEGRYTECGFFVGVDSFAKVYDIIDQKGGLETSNGHQDAELAKDLVRYFELTRQGANFISNQDGLRDAVIRLREEMEDRERNEIDAIQQRIHRRRD